MSEAATQTAPTVSISKSALARIETILAKQKPGTALRVAVSGGGCSGFQYEYNLVPFEPQDDDLVLGNEKARVLVDSLSLEFLQGAEIDFVNDLIGQSFQINNPNAVASCGCGTSFSV
jgi:iron-sulfur cluster assembly accessory protein